MYNNFGRFIKGHIPWNKNRIEQKCLVCGKVFYTTLYYIKNGWGKTCSMVCNGIIRRKTKLKKCSICNNKFFSYYKKQKYCSHKCFGISYKGTKHTQETLKKISNAKKREKCYFWKGGISHHGEGYILILKPKHPFATKAGYVLRSHLVMERVIGRYLLPTEIVHHKGIKYPIGSIKNKQDDRKKNLQLFVNNSTHIKFHKLYP